jgi:hypothetical protein
MTNKKKSIKELSKELGTKVPLTPQAKLGFIKMLILRIFGIKLKPNNFVVGDVLKRKTSDNPKELYEVRQNLYDSGLNRVVLCLDLQHNKLITVNELDFSSFTKFNGVMPGTMVNPNDI